MLSATLAALRRPHLDPVTLPHKLSVSRARRHHSISREKSLIGGLVKYFAQYIRQQTNDACHAAHTCSSVANLVVTNGASRTSACFRPLSTRIHSSPDST